MRFLFPAFGCFGGLLINGLAAFADDVGKPEVEDGFVDFPLGAERCAIFPAVFLPDLGAMTCSGPWLCALSLSALLPPSPPAVSMPPSSSDSGGRSALADRRLPWLPYVLLMTGLGAL